LRPLREFPSIFIHLIVKIALLVKQKFTIKYKTQVMPSGLGV